MTDYDFSIQPTPQSCRLVDFEEVRVDPGIIPETFFLTVRGKKPCLNMEVRLTPLVYIRCPEFWGIEVIGCLPGGICLPALGSYEVTIPLAGSIGSQGIEVIGATKQKKLDVSGGCKPIDPCQ